VKGETAGVFTVLTGRAGWLVLDSRQHVGRIRIDGHRTRCAARIGRIFHTTERSAAVDQLVREVGEQYLLRLVQVVACRDEHEADPTSPWEQATRATTGPAPAATIDQVIAE